MQLQASIAAMYFRFTKPRQAIIKAARPGPDFGVVLPKQEAGCGDHAGSLQEMFALIVQTNKPIVSRWLGKRDIFGRSVGSWGSHYLE